MYKNTASQKIAVFAFDATTSLPKSGDSANITVYVNKDWGGVNALTDTSATELDATNAKGWYVFDVSQTESNADVLHFTGKSVTSNIVVVGIVIFTRPANFSTTSIDSSGRLDVAKAAGTAWNSGAITSGTFATDSITSTALATSADTEIAAAVWDLATSGHTTAGTFGKAVTDAAAAGTPPSAGTIADAVWDDLTASHVTAGTFGKLVQDINSGTFTMNSTERNAIADALLNRDMSLGLDSGSPTVRTPRQAFRSLRNKWSIQTNQLTVYKEDDSTQSWTATISTTADANPVTSTDPAGP